MGKSENCWVRSLALNLSNRHFLDFMSSSDAAGSSRVSLSSKYELAKLQAMEMMKTLQPAGDTAPHQIPVSTHQRPVSMSAATPIRRNEPVSSTKDPQLDDSVVLRTTLRRQTKEMEELRLQLINTQKLLASTQKEFQITEKIMGGYQAEDERWAKENDAQRKEYFSSIRTVRTMLILRQNTTIGGSTRTNARCRLAHTLLRQRQK